MTENRPGISYTVAATFATEDDETGKEIFAVRHATLTTMRTLAYEAPLTYLAGTVVAVWDSPDNEAGTRPDWVGVVNVHGELMRLVDRYRDQVAL